MEQNRPIVYEFNCTTNEEVVREMNDEEYAQYLIDKAAHEAEMQAENPA